MSFPRTCRHLACCITDNTSCAGMLAQQLGDLEAAEHHYEQQLSLIAPGSMPDGDSSEHAAAYVDVMKVDFWAVTLHCALYFCLSVHRLTVW